MEYLSDKIFKERSAEAANLKPIRKELSLSEFQIEGNDKIIIDGQPIKISQKAFGKLLKRLRIPPAFANRFTDQFGEDGLKQLMAMLKSHKSSKNDTRVTLLANPKTMVIDDILPAGTAAISNEAFVDFSSNIIDRFDLKPTQFGTDDLGGVIINTVNDKNMFSVDGMKDENFYGGVTFSNIPGEGLVVSPFLERLVCSNGMTSRIHEDTFKLTSLQPDIINEFNGQMADLASIGFRPMGLFNNVRRASEVQASVSEVHGAMSMLMSKSPKTMTNEYIQRYIPTNRIEKAYEDYSSPIREMNKKQLRTANSGMTIWDAVNGMTNFASNDNNPSLGDFARADIMKAAGKLLNKTNYDFDAIVSTDPFHGGGIVGSAEMKFLRGE
jgi:hypothetical protein